MTWSIKLADERREACEEGESKEDRGDIEPPESPEVCGAFCYTRQSVSHVGHFDPDHRMVDDDSYHLIKEQIRGLWGSG